MFRKTLILILTLLPLASTSSPAPVPQPYNFSFDTWSRTRGSWNPYPENATKEQRVWDTANRGLALLGVNGTFPEYEHVAVAGNGKAAARIESKKVLWAFVAGSIYNGEFVRIIKTSGAEMKIGTPYRHRPTRFSGYYHYIPATVNYAKAPHEDMKGKPDVARIDLLLMDWTEPYTLDTTTGNFLDGDKDPHVIGRALIDIDKATNGYIHFDIPIEYRSDRTPGYIVITAASSRYGDSFTGADGSVLYIDEFRLD